MPRTSASSKFSGERPVVLANITRAYETLELFIRAFGTPRKLGGHFRGNYIESRNPRSFRTVDERNGRNVERELEGVVGGLSLVFIVTGGG